ncbi:MAG: PRC-barrel domain-containing protein [Mycetocola sp.]
MLDSRDIGGLQGAPVIGRDDDKLGTVGQVFLDSQTGAPNWVTVRTGLFGHKETFIPLADARWDGEVVRVDIDRETVKEAPRIDTDEALSPHNEEALYRYYGLSDRDTDGGTARPGEYPEREYDLGPDGQSVTPIPTGSTDASRHDDDTAAVAADTESTHGDSETPRHTNRDRDEADAPRNLADFHPEANQQYGTRDPHDLRMSEEPLGEPMPPASEGALAGEPTGKHSRMRRYDPAVDGADTNGRRIDQSEPPRTL